MVSWFHSRAKVAIVCSVLLTILLLSANKAHAYTSPNTQEDVARYTGAYGMEPGALLFVRRANRWSFEPPSTLLSSRLFLVDEHGGTCTLVPAGEKSFTVSPTDASNGPRIKVHFIESQDGHIVALRWVAHGLADRVLPRFSGYREEEVTFEGPSGTLGGRLLLPSTHVPAPAVILIAGAGPTDRHQEYFVVADVFASQGFATLIYDKRGTGISSGNWRIASPSDLADDALAGFRFLQTRSEIDSGRIGLYGLSEGGLVVGIAASRNPDVAFLIVVSAPGVSRSTWERRWVQNELRAAALSHHEIGDALRFVALEDRFVRGKVAWSRLEHASRAAREQRWFPYTWMGIFDARSPDHWAWTWRRLHNDLDSSRVFIRVSYPILAIWGGLDTYAPDLHKAAVEKALKRGKSLQHDLKVFARADHLIKEESDRHCRRSYAAGYFHALVHWARRVAPIPNLH